MPELRFTRKAETDLSEIADYTAGTWGPRQADRYVDKLQRFFVLLALTPFMGREVDQRGKKRLRSSIRRIEIGSHVVFYEPTTRGISVLRILHDKIKFSEHDFDES